MGSTSVVVDFRKHMFMCIQAFSSSGLQSDLGVHGPLLQAAIKIDWSVFLIPKSGGPSIDSMCGVKQGDALSSLLLRLFIDCSRLKAAQVVIRSRSH